MGLTVNNVDHRERPTDDIRVTFDIGTLLKDSSNPETMDLVSSIYEAYERHKLKIEEINANNVAYLDQKHEEAVVKAREAKDAFDSTSLYGSRFMADRRELDARLSRAHLNLRTITIDKPNPSYALKADYANHERRITEAQAEVDAALVAMQSHEVEMESWRRSAETRRAALAEAGRIEEDLRWRLQKAKGVKVEARPDRETGFMVS